MNVEVFWCAEALAGSSPRKGSPFVSLPLAGVVQGERDCTPQSCLQTSGHSLLSRSSADHSGP